MNTTKFARWFAPALCLVSAACSGGGSGGSETNPMTIVSATQDLNLDANGTTTVITFSRGVGTLDASAFEADGGQTALTASADGDEVTVVWNERVTPQHQVRVVGNANVDSSYAAVDTTNDDAPTFVVTDAQQVAGLGGDVITLDFSGVRLVESEAEDASNWTISVNAQALDMTGSTLVLSIPLQIVTITTGPSCNLHADFQIAATGVHSVADVSVDPTVIDANAVGDAVAPNLISAEQNLAEDEYGRVVDFTFDEAMDPVFATSLANFVGAGSDLAVGVEQPSEDVLRVSFNNPIVPGLDSITLENLVDAHGNALPDQATAIVAATTVANDWTNDPELVTVPDTANDYVWVEFDQALDPDTAGDLSHWELEVDGAPYDLSNSTATYDFLGKSLLITLSDDVHTGDAFVFQALPPDPPVDVDGQFFVGTFTGTITGDSGAPTIASAMQNRTVDPEGLTIDVSFSEDVDEATAENLANWACSSANVTDARLLISGYRVRLTLDALAIPGIDTIDCSGVEDVAGNTMVAVVGQALTTNDQGQPHGDVATATAVEGVGNDTLEVLFTDTMVESYVEDPANWTFESPTGTVLDVSNASIVYDSATLIATLTFTSATGIALQTDDDFTVGWVNLLDIGGNVITSATLTGEIAGETTLPQVVSVWLENASQNHLHVRFSESCQGLDDIAGSTLYVVEDSLGVVRGSPTSATVDSDARGVDLEFAFAIASGSDVLDVSGVRDTCGNPCFPLQGLAIAAEDSNEVALDNGLSQVVTVTGERNDVITVVFDRTPTPWNLLDPSNYALSTGGNPIDISGASFSWDGDVTVTIVLDAAGGPNLETGTNYDLDVTGVESAQGVSMTGTSSETILATGDSTAPDLPAGMVKLDAASPTDTLLLEMDEAIDPTDAVDTSKVLLNGAINPDTAELVGARTVRAVFSGGVALGDTVQVDWRDLAGNLGSVSRTVSAADVAGPLVTSVAGFMVSGTGGDYIEVSFDKQLELASALSSSNYTVTLDSNVMDITGSLLTYDAATATVTIHLPDGFELDWTQSMTIGVSDVYDLAGLAISPAASVGGPIGGDAVAPDFAAAFVDLHEDATGSTVDVLFTEEVRESFVTLTANWGVSGGQSVLAVEHRGEAFWRVTLSAPLGASETLDLTALPDLAGNVSGAISIAPAN
jgi:hypothetical protein